MRILKRVQSICPVCRRAIDAEYVERDGKVYFEKTCPSCGSFSTISASDADEFTAWDAHPVANVPPKRALTQGAEGECPLHCGTCQRHLQTACCVIIDVTKRCNQHCPYCFARADEDDFSSHEPTLQEISEKCDFLLELGEERPFNIQLSGGEPTVRDDLPEMIELIKSKGFEYIQINSNGRRIAREEGYARRLRRAGASVVFMQFDGTRDDIYLKLRGEKLLDTKKKAVINCRKAGLPVTIVPTIVRGVNLDNIGGMIQFLLYNVDVVKGIHFQPVSYFGRRPETISEGETYSERVTMFDVMHEISRQNPQFKYDDFCPINTGHPLCCFYSTYLKEGPGKVKCLLGGKAREKGIPCCDVPAGDVLSREEQDERLNLAMSLSGDEQLEVIRRDRDFVMKKWDIPEGSGGAEAPEISYTDAPMSMDEFLSYYRRNTFTVTGMAFQDRSNLDAERVKRCRVQVLTDDNRLVPFCGYVSLSDE